MTFQIRLRSVLLDVVLSIILLVLAWPGSANAQMVTGSRMPGYAETLGIVLNQKSYPYSVQLISSDAPGNILWPGEQAGFTFQLVNNTAAPIVAKGKVDLIHYATRGIPGDIWKPEMFKIADLGSMPIEVNLAAKGFQDITVSPNVPAEFGAYALVVDLGAQGRQFIGTFVRTFAVSGQRVQYSKLCLDALPIDVLKRLGVHAVRYELSYKPTTEKDFPQWLAQHEIKLKALHDANITVMFMVGGPGFFGDYQPLKRPRPWLDDHDVMLDRSQIDLAWMPAYDADFRQWSHLMAARFGWPKGPCTAMYLWNEPWEGASIAGWGADMLRYREIFTNMCEGVEEARKQDGVQILLGGFDSTSNAMDKMFGDGKDTFLKWCDFISIHYQGLDGHTTVKKWVDRKAPTGRVRIWDTESWIANCDDRVAAAIAAFRAAGYDRAMGVFRGNVAEPVDGVVQTADGKNHKVNVVQVWPVAASLGAANRFIGEREFHELLFKNGLPWVMVFDGQPSDDGNPNAEDGTVVVVGDLGEEFKPDDLPFRTARGFKEIEHKRELKAKLAGFPRRLVGEDRDLLEAAIAKPEVLSGATMTIAADSRYSLYDFYGNPVPARDGKIVIPLDGRGFFLRGDGKAGSFPALQQAIRDSHIDGIEPVALVAHDMTARIEKHPALRLSLTNVLNRPITGTLHASLGSLVLASASQEVSLAANETKDVELHITDGVATADNSYPLALTFDAGKDGAAVHEEQLHVNVITRRTIAVDGKLDDWNGILPQIIKTNGPAGPSLTEAAWLPFKTYDESVKKGLATGYLAYDDDNFYFAAKIADTTPDAGMPRYETLDPDEYFYPETCYRIDRENALQKKDVIWAESSDDVRALQKPGDSKDRIAAAWQTTLQSFAIDLKLPKGTPHQVALYFLDWQQPGRRGAVVEIIDTATGRSLDRKFIAKYGFGKYAVYQLTGDARIKISGNNAPGATLAGIFFDPIPTPDPKAKVQPGKLVKTDEDTQGNWKGVYGADGYQIVGVDAKLPAYVTMDFPTVVNRSEFHWPQGIRRYSYRRDPILPAGNFPNHDNVQIAFNVLPMEQKPWYPFPPGTFLGFTTYPDTDYEFALNPVAEKYGGGTEIWRMAVPGMPHKHFYPRQPKSPFDGAVKTGKLAISRDATTRIVECAIPWSEIPEVKKRLDAGQTIKFSFRANDNADVGCMELSRGRSVAKHNGSFHCDWVEHWANEVEFGFER